MYVISWWMVSLVGLVWGWLGCVGFVGCWC